MNFNKAVELHEKGLSTQNIADLYQTSRTSMWGILKRRGCKFMTYSEAGRLCAGEKNGNYKHGHRVNGMRSPELDKCYRQLRSALELGTIIKEPCQICGNPKVEGHHKDYSKPYEVQWLCRKHHYAIHRISAHQP